MLYVNGQWMTVGQYNALVTLQNIIDSQRPARRSIMIDSSGQLIDVTPRKLDLPDWARGLFDVLHAVGGAAATAFGFGALVPVLGNLEREAGLID